MPWEQEFWTETADQIQSFLTTWLPSLLGALLLLVAGWLVARLIQAVIIRLLRRFGLDRLAERTGIARALTNLGVESALSRILARLSYWLVMIFFILLSLGALGLTDVVSSALSGFFTFLPRLVTATIIFLVGTFIARVVGDAVSAMADQSDIARGLALGQALRYSIILVVLILALDELGVQTTILTLIVIAIITAVCFGLALAFGLGSRQLAHNIMAGFHAREEFSPGQVLTVGDYSGRLVRIGATKALIDTELEKVSVPNTLLLSEVVKLQPVEAVVSTEDDEATIVSATEGDE